MAHGPELQHPEWLTARANAPGPVDDATRGVQEDSKRSQKRRQQEHWQQQREHEQVERALEPPAC
jgi:hypothetical protein